MCTGEYAGAHKCPYQPLTLIYRKPAEILTKTSILMQNCTADDMAKRNWQNKGWDLKKGLFYQSRK